MAWRTSAIMKASWLMPASAVTAPISIKSQNAPANDGQLSTVQLTAPANAWANKMMMTMTVFSSSVSGKIASPAINTNGRKA
jgi:hypothetical protein